MMSDLSLYDFVFVTHLPSFYKINLYNEIAKQHRVLVIFIGGASNLRENDFTRQHKRFDHIYLSKGAFEQRTWRKNIAKLRQVFKSLQYRALILGGWDLWEYWWLAITQPKQKNYLALESSCFESSATGLKRKLKQCFLSRLQGVFYSGTPHLQLLEEMEYTGGKIKTGGVGLMQMNLKELIPQEQTQINHLEQSTKFIKRFLYVGRLAAEKNLEILIDYFAHHPDLTLTIVGSGPLQQQLKQSATNNVQFLGHVAYDQLDEIYQQHDIFLLPSLREPWGLVVEEALYHGLPVVASNRVGASIDLIDHYQAGRLFEPASLAALTDAVDWVIKHYGTLKKNISLIPFDQRAQAQVQSYQNALTDSV